jgi:hypothetical protein
MGLYVNPPQHAAVFCLDEKSGVRAFDRLDRILPLSPGRAERHGFEYNRHGTLSLFAALNTRTGTVLGQTAPRHTTEELVAFLARLVAPEPAGRAIHIVLDNFPVTKLSGFSSSWPNIQCSPALHPDLLLLAQSGRDLVRQNRTPRHRPRHLHFGKDLARKLMRYIHLHNRSARPIKWSYCDPSHRITFEPCVTDH